MDEKNMNQLSLTGGGGTRILVFRPLNTTLIFYVLFTEGKKGHTHAHILAILSNGGSER